MKFGHMFPPLVENFLAAAAAHDGRALDREDRRFLELAVKSKRLPHRAESVGVSLFEQKAAALLFDRVWSPPGYEGRAPDDIAVYGATDIEVMWDVLCTGIAKQALVAAGNQSRDSESVTPRQLRAGIARKDYCNKSREILRNHGYDAPTF